MTGSRAAERGTATSAPNAAPRLVSRHREWQISTIPTAHQRAQVTLTPRVRRIVDLGRERWPTKTPGAILVASAERATGAAPRSTALVMLSPVPGRTVTSQMVEDALEN